LRRRSVHSPGQRSDPSLPAGTDRLPQIKHIVVLMMANHSFDNYLGTVAGRGEGLPAGAAGLPDAAGPACSEPGVGLLVAGAGGWLLLGLS